MRLTKETAEELVKEVAGEDTVKLVGLLKDQENVSEFKIAEKLRLTVNTVRNMLYRLQAHNLVTSTRKKDKKKGWYIYYWTFNTPQARSLVRVVKTKKLDQLKDRLRTETQESFYVCPEKCTRFNQVHAMDYDFKCPECGNVLQEENNIDFIEKLKANIALLEEDLAKPIMEIRTKPEVARKTRRKSPKPIRINKPKLKALRTKKLKLRNVKNLKPTTKIRRLKIRKIIKPRLRIKKPARIKIKRVIQPKTKKIIRNLIRAKPKKRPTREPKKKSLFGKFKSFLRRK